MSMALMTRRQFGRIAGLVAIEGIVGTPLLLAHDKPAKEQARSHSAVHVQNRRLFQMAGGKLYLGDPERRHLHTCAVCQGVLYVLINQRQPNHQLAFSAR